MTAYFFSNLFTFIKVKARSSSLNCSSASKSSRFTRGFQSQKSELRRRSRAPLTRQRSSARHVFQTCAHARRSGANPPLAAGFETRSTARKATFPEAGRRCHRRKSPRLFGHPLCFRLPAGKQKIFRHEQHKPPNARFGSFAIHAEDFASVIIFRLIRQTRANGRIACLRVYCTIRAGFVNAFLHAPTLDIFSPSGV